MAKIKVVNKSDQVKQNSCEHIMTRDEILGVCKPIESAAVEVPGWPGKVRMRNVPFQELVDLRATAPEGGYHAMFIAAVCEDLNVSDAYKLQSGNGIQFSLLLNAVNSFLGLDLDDKVKK